MKAAVLGYGTVGAGVYSMLSDAPGMEAGPVLVRPGKAVENFMVSDAALIFGDPTVDAVVETLGGLDPAYSYGMRALEAGKHFITANKAMVAAHGLELAALAREKGAAFLFSAACGGGVPFLHNLALSAETNRIETVSGILNGTTNYMLDAMQRRGLSYGDALREAQSLGYAESDPTADVSGLDALRKMQLACAVAFGVLPQSGMLWSTSPPRTWRISKAAVSSAVLWRAAAAPRRAFRRMWSRCSSPVPRRRARFSRITTWRAIPANAAAPSC